MVVESAPSLFDRTFPNLRRMWREVSRREPGAISHTIDSDLQAASAEQLRARMRECLEARGGEVSARARAADLGETYLRLTPAGRRLFLSILAHDFGLSRDELRIVASDYVGAQDSAEQRR